ncbi:MAG: DUF2934 domain-containing protein [Rhodoferax sp.]
MKHPQASTHASTDDAVRKKSHRSGKKGNGEEQSAVDLKTKAGDKGHDEIIRQTAYSYYEARGYVGGYDLDDWLQAEANVGQTTGRDMGAP